MSLKGSLQTVALPEVLDFLSGTGKTGELKVDGAGAEGLIWFDEGFISGVRVRRGPNPVEAVFQLLRIDEGEFDFDTDQNRPEDVTAVDRSEGQVGRVLEQAQERLRQWSEIVSVVPSLEHRVTLAATAPSDTISLDRSQWELIVAIGEGHTVGDVIASCGLGEFEGSQAVKSLIEGSLIQLGEPASAVGTVVEEPPTAVEDSAVPPGQPSSASDDPFAGVAPMEAPSDRVGDREDQPEAVDDGSVQPSFGVFTGFGPNSYASDSHPGEDFADQPASGRPEGDASSSNGWAASRDPFSDYAAQAEPTRDDPAPTVEADADRYASLRSAIAEMGESLEADPYLSEGNDEDAGMPPFGSALPYSVLGDGDAHDHTDRDEGPTDGHAALQALLAEVTSEEFVPEDDLTPDGEEPVDGLADRGPWTRTELASFDGWQPDEAFAPAGDQRPVTRDAFGEAVAHDFRSAEVTPGPAAEAADVSAADGEAGEEPEPVEEPINRGLLLKFLSSVRN